MKREIPACNVCIGEKTPNCICDGDGTIYGENTGLRKELYRLSKENELLKTQLVKDLKRILDTPPREQPK